MSSKAPQNRPLNYKAAPSKKTATIERGVKKLKTYKAETPTTNAVSQSLLNIVIGQYESRDILNIQTAASLAHSLMHNNLNEFGKKYAIAMVGVQNNMSSKKHQVRSNNNDKTKQKTNLYK